MILKSSFLKSKCLVLLPIIFHYFFFIFKQQNAWYLSHCKFLLCAEDKILSIFGLDENMKFQMITFWTERFIRFLLIPCIWKTGLKIRTTKMHRILIREKVKFNIEEFWDQCWIFSVNSYLCGTIVYGRAFAYNWWHFQKKCYLL